MTEITTQLNTQLSRVKLHGLRTNGPAGCPPTLVVVAHGSRDPRALKTITALLHRVRTLRPRLPVRLGHIELNEPLLGETLAELRGEAVVVPLLLSRGYHVKHDIPTMLADAPQVSARIADPLGPHPLLAEALHDRLMEAGLRPGPRTGVVLAAAGSRDPDSARDTGRTADLLSARLGGIPVLPAYAAAAGPTVPEAVRILADRGLTPTIASYFTAPGRFATESALPGHLAAAPLGAHPALARLLLHRYDQALRGGADAAPARPPERTQPRERSEADAVGV